jgi:hypothetical protein
MSINETGWELGRFAYDKDGIANLTFVNYHSGLEFWVTFNGKTFKIKDQGKTLDANLTWWNGHKINLIGD